MNPRPAYAKIKVTYYRMENFRNGQGSAAREGIHMYHYTLPVSNKNIVEIVKRAFLVPYTIFAFFAISSGIVSPRISASCLLMTMV